MNFINHNEYSEIHYFGDKYLPDGNDHLLLNHEHVIGHKIDSVDQTLELLKKLKFTNNIIDLKENISILNENNFIDNLFLLLSQLTESPQLSYNKISEILSNLSSNHHIFVYLNDNKLPIGIITLIIEQKLIHEGKCVGHIEDLVVDNNYNGKGIALQLIDHCVKLAEKNNCYKIILDCKEELVPFYNKNKFKQQGICMRFDI